MSSPVRSCNSSLKCSRRYLRSSLVTHLISCSSCLIHQWQRHSHCLPFSHDLFCSALVDGLSASTVSASCVPFPFTSSYCRVALTWSNSASMSTNVSHAKLSASIRCHIAVDCRLGVEFDLRYDIKLSCPSELMLHAPLFWCVPVPVPDGMGVIAFLEAIDDMAEQESRKNGEEANVKNDSKQGGSL